MVNKIIVFTHGDLSYALKRSAEMIAGPLNNVITFQLNEGCDLEEKEKEVEKTIVENQMKGYEVLVLTDIFYGSPFNIIVNLMNRFSIYHITGINLPLLLEFALYQDRFTKSFIKETINLANGNIKLIDFTEDEKND